MLADTPIHSFVRVTLECVSPLLIATGKASGGYDNEVLRDANGLPFIPGSSLAGVLRHLWKRWRGEAEQEETSPFGFQALQGDDGQPSRISFTPALLVLEDGGVAEGLTIPDEKDAVVNWLRTPQPLMRDRVRIGHRGAAEDSGKYDIVLLPRGTRFRFELCWRTSDSDETRDLDALLGLLGGATFRLGAKTRSGLGQVRAVSVSTVKYDLRQPADVQRFLQRQRSLVSHAAADEAVEWNPQRLESGVFQACQLQLQSISPLRIGGGGKSFLRARNNDKTADALLLSEPGLEWPGGRAEWREHSLVIPGSSIKGALRHRFTYHLRRYLGCFTTEANEAMGDQGTFRRVIEQLFGSEQLKQRQGDSDGQVSALLVDDVLIQPATLSASQIGKRQHNSIDRFTGGTLDGALYSQEYLHDVGFAVNLLIDADRMAACPSVWSLALKDTLDDLCNGDLALGAGTGRGMGVCQGKHDYEAEGAE